MKKLFLSLLLLCACITPAYAARPLTANMTTVVKQTSLKPITLVEMTFANTSTVHTAQENYTISGQLYKGIVKKISGSRDINESDFLYGIPIEAFDMELVNVTDAAIGTPISRKFDSNSAKSTTVKVYQWFDGEGLSTADKLLLFQGSIATYSYDETLFKCVVANELWKANSPVGTLIDLTTWPSAAPKAIGRPTNIVYGDCENVLTQNIVAGGADILAVALTDTATSITISHLPNAKRFPPGGTDFTIKIHNEEIRITNYVDATGVLTVAASGRGYNGTIATEHGVGRALWEVLASYDYLVADHAVKSIGDIFVNGSKVLTGATKVLTPKAKIQLSPDLILETGADNETVAPGLLHGDNNRTVRLYGRLETDYTTGSADCDVPSTTPTLGPVKSVTAYVRLYNHGVADTDLDITENGTGITLSYLDLTLPAGENTYVLPASAVTADMTWSTALSLQIFSSSQAITILEVYFDVTYDGTGVAPVNVEIVSAPIGVIAGTVPGYTHTLEVATDTETLGNIVGVSMHMTIRNEGTAKTFGVDVTNSNIDFAAEDITFIATTTWDIVAGASAFTATAPWAADLEADIDGTGLIIDNIYFRVLYQDPDYFKPGSVDMDGLTAADIEIGRRVTCDVEGYKTAGGALIDNPSEVQAHFIDTYSGGLTRKGTEFTNTSTATSSYKFAGVIRSHENFVDILARMAFESRVKIWDDGTQIRTAHMPGSWTATTTVPKAEIATGLKIIEANQNELVNKLFLRYNKDLGVLPDRASWFNLYNTSDATSITKYGTRERPELFLFEFVNDQTTAESVGAYYLASFKDARRYVQSTMFLDNLALEPYDVLNITHNATAINLASQKLLVLPPFGMQPGYREQDRMFGTKINFMLREVQ